MPSGKTAIVIRSTSGIGLNMTEALTGGANVVLNSFGTALAVDGGWTAH